MNRILFLDIDGVLNSQTFLAERRFRQAEEDKRRMPKTEAQKKILAKKVNEPIDPKNVEQLNFILDETGAKIVVSSYWRYSHPIEVLENVLRHYGCLHPISDYTPMKSGAESCERGLEIASFLGANEVDRYVILDDVDDFLPVQKRWWVRCNPAFGLRQRDAERAIELLLK